MSCFFKEKIILKSPFTRRYLSRLVGSFPGLDPAGTICIEKKDWTDLRIIVLRIWTYEVASAVLVAALPKVPLALAKRRETCKTTVLHCVSMGASKPALLTLTFKFMSCKVMRSVYRSLKHEHIKWTCSFSAIMRNTDCSFSYMLGSGAVSGGVFRWLQSAT